jgi:hypothetical protein
VSAPKIPTPKLPDLDLPNPVDVIKDAGKAVVDTTVGVVEGVGEVTSDIIYTARTGDINRKTQKLEERMERAKEQYSVAYQDNLDGAHDHIQALIERRNLSLIHEIVGVSDATPQTGALPSKLSDRYRDVDAHLEQTPTTRMLEQIGLSEASETILQLNTYFPASGLSDFILLVPYGITRQSELNKARKQLRQNCANIHQATSKVRARTIWLRAETEKIEVEIDVLEDEIEAFGFDPEDHAPTMMRIRAKEHEVMVEFAKTLIANGTDAETIIGITKLPADQIAELMKSMGK